MLKCVPCFHIMTVNGTFIHSNHHQTKKKSPFALLRASLALTEWFLVRLARAMWLRTSADVKMWGWAVWDESRSDRAGWATLMMNWTWWRERKITRVISVTAPSPSQQTEECVCVYTMHLCISVHRHVRYACIYCMCVGMFVFCFDDFRRQGRKKHLKQLPHWEEREWWSEQEKWIGRNCSCEGEKCLVLPFLMYYLFILVFLFFWNLSPKFHAHLHLIIITTCSLGNAHIEHI